MSIYFAVEFDEKTNARLKQKQLLVKQNSTQGDFVQPETFHITVLFCVGGDGGYSRSEYVELLDEFGRRYKDQLKPFDLKLQNFCQFPGRNDNGNVVWVGVRDSFPLYEIKDNLEKTIQSMNIKKEKSQHNSYTPHITMAYDCILKDGFNTLFEEDEPVTIKSLVLWDSFKAGKNGNDAHVYNKVHELFF
ncbi:gp240 [Bacillus phage G]|uniref:Gp240 n=1 Tax=Bacillus phage G TaxID=2884420 RepID=G3M9Y1_9CAUD|nr:gp240 [Bacillus phage G]AEO93499.1 gp240 [Bacillus phage G]